MKPTEGARVGSTRNLLWIPNNSVADLGIAQIGVGGVDPGPPTRALLAVIPQSSPPSDDIVINLGDTFQVGEETWRFADVDFESRNRFRVCLRRVDADEPQDPPSGKIWPQIRLDPYGTLDDSQIAALTAQLGQRLPAGYEDWLRRNNGARPADVYRVGDFPFFLAPEAPLLGVHPEYPPFDLVTAQRRYRDKFLSRSYLVIAVPSGAGGLVAVKTDGMDVDSIWYLPSTAMTGWQEPADRERQMVGLGLTIDMFLGRLEPYVLPDDLPPARVVYRDKAGPDSPFYRGSEEN
jgi:hypothetical protein